MIDVISVTGAEEQVISQSTALVQTHDISVSSVSLASSFLNHLKYYVLFIIIIAIKFHE